jgi:hypothetical protein
MDREFSFWCQGCKSTGAPVRVESLSEAHLVLSIECGNCGHQWTTLFSLPAFMKWLRPERQRRASSADRHQ